MVSVGDAYEACERIARAHYENFPVASWLLPRHMRPHVAVVYAFARTADDFADEGDVPAATRLQLLDGWERRLLHAAHSAEPPWPAEPGEPRQSGEIFIALRESIRARSLPVQHFQALLSAFRQDVTTTRYRTWDEMMQYCQRSANPVGRLVLRIAGYDDRNLDAASDAICAALQLTNFWQDLKIDFERDRVYLPADERQRHGALERDLADGHITVEWQRALSTAVARTRLLFDEGRYVCDGVRGRLRYELRATWLGGVRILDRLEAVHFDVVRRRPTLGFADALLIAPRVIAWRPTAALS
ncbi:MAG TPA: squalene synthase HpnC [Vicinamibacterales bacterium]|nr:squalene synthase HpnC [Vicinamibacterales bacterium]